MQNQCTNVVCVCSSFLHIHRLFFLYFSCCLCVSVFFFLFRLYQNVEKQVLNNMRKCFLLCAPMSGTLKWPYCVKCSAIERSTVENTPDRWTLRFQFFSLSYIYRVLFFFLCFFVPLLLFTLARFKQRTFKSLDAHRMDI